MSEHGYVTDEAELLHQVVELLTEIRDDLKALRSVATETRNGTIPTFIDPLCITCSHSESAPIHKQNRCTFQRWYPQMEICAKCSLPDTDSRHDGLGCVFTPPEVY